MLSRPDLILYDWDGTLVDTIEGIRQGINTARKHFGMTEWTLEDAHANVRKSAREAFPIWFGDKADEALKIYLNFIALNQLNFLKTMPDAEKLLQAVSVFGVKQGIVSNKRHDFLINEVRAVGWEKYFDVCVGAGTARRDKPAPDSILHAIEKLPIRFSNIWYVGDTDTDMQAAEAAQCSKVFINHGMCKLENMKGIDLDLSILDCSDLQRKIEELFLNKACTLVHIG